MQQHRRVDLSGPPVYREALRRLLGGPEGLFALLDALPAGKGAIEPARLQNLERRFLGWRWRLRDRDERLRPVHRDLRLEHVSVLPGPEVVIFEPDFVPGDPALDVSAIAVCLLELGAREPLSWGDGYRPLFDAFWSTYLGESGDHELLDVAPPFLAWQALRAVTSPAPLSAAARQKLFDFAEEALTQRSFNPDGIRWLER